MPKPRWVFLVASSLVASVLAVGLMALVVRPGELPAAHLLGSIHYRPADDGATAAARG